MQIYERGKKFNIYYFYSRVLALKMVGEGVRNLHLVQKAIISRKTWSTLECV